MNPRLRLSLISSRPQRRRPQARRLRHLHRHRRQSRQSRSRKEILSGTGYTVTGSGVESGPDEHILVLTANNVTLTSSTVANYITARPLDGYNVSFYVNTAEAELGYAGNIYINYQTTATEQTWNDGTFLYSNIYQRETYTRVLMPEGEVALSLYMGDTETVVDTVAYTQSNNRIYNGNGDRLYTDRQTTTSDDDGDEIGERATYTYIGNHTSGFGDGTYFFLNENHNAPIF